MKKGTDVTYLISIGCGIPISKISEAFVIFKQNKITIRKEGTILPDMNAIRVDLTYEETSKFYVKPIEVQIRALTTSGKTVESNIMYENVEKSLSEVRLV